MTLKQPFVIYYMENCSWWSDSTKNISDDYWFSPDACENYYWMDFASDGNIDVLNFATFNYHFSIYPDSTFPIINNPNNPCFGKHLGEECCISN